MLRMFEDKFSKSIYAFMYWVNVKEGSIYLTAGISILLGTV